MATEPLSLRDAIFQVHNLQDNSVVCAKEPFSLGSQAIVGEFTEDYRVPDSILNAGFIYFLGKEEIIELLEMISKKEASPETQAEFVCYYAAQDAYPAWFDQLPDIPS